MTNYEYVCFACNHEEKKEVEYEKRNEQFCSNCGYRTINCSVEKEEKGG